MTESCAALSKVSDDARLNNHKNIKINSVPYHARMKLAIETEQSPLENQKAIKDTKEESFLNPRIT